MQLQFGQYLFPIGSSKLAGTNQLLFNQGGQPYAQKRTLSVEGHLAPVNATQDSLVLAENLLKTALAAWGPSLIFLTDDGTPTGLTMLQRGSIEGVRITQGPDFKTTQGPEYCVYRSFSFAAEAEYPLNGTTNLLLDFTETLTFTGGKPIYRHRLAINGPPQKQLTYPFTTYMLNQSGRATGYLKAPALGGDYGAQPPIYPNALKEAGRIAPTSPTRRGAGYQGFGVTWSYDMEDANPLPAIPNIWIN